MSERDDDVVALLDQAHGDAGDGSLDGHAGIHQSQRRSARGSHGGRAVGLENLGDHANGVGELVLGGQHGQNRSLGEGAVTDFTTLGCAHAARLAGAVRREVVLVHVALGLGGIDGVKTLRLVEKAQGAHGQSLGLTTLEQAGAVDAGQISRDDIAADGSPRRAAVGTLARLDDHVAHGRFSRALQRGCDVAAPSVALLVGEVVLLD